MHYRSYMTIIQDRHFLYDYFYIDYNLIFSNLTSSMAEAVRANQPAYNTSDLSLMCMPQLFIDRQ